MSVLSILKCILVSPKEIQIYQQKGQVVQILEILISAYWVFQQTQSDLDA